MRSQEPQCGNRKKPQGRALGLEAPRVAPRKLVKDGLALRCPCDPEGV